MLQPAAHVGRRRNKYLLCSLFSHVVFAVGIYKFAPAKLAVVKRGNERLSGCDIGCKGNIVNIAKTEQAFLSLGDLLGGVGASEIEYEVYLVKGNSGGYLLCSAGAACEEGFYFKSGSVCDVLAGRMGCEKMVAAENCAIRNAKLSHEFFFVVFGNNSYIHYVSFLSQDDSDL